MVKFIVKITVKLWSQLQSNYNQITVKIKVKITVQIRVKITVKIKVKITFMHSYVSTFLHSYIPTFLQSYIPSFLHSSKKRSNGKKKTQKKPKTVKKHQKWSKATQTVKIHQKRSKPLNTSKTPKMVQCPKESVFFMAFLRLTLLVIGDPCHMIFFFSHRPLCRFCLFWYRCYYPQSAHIERLNVSRMRGFCNVKFL